MDLQHVNVKIFAEHPEGVELEKSAYVFHRWIQEQTLAEMLIDVADYLHVPAGPGMVLIGRDADYYLDETGHRLGLRYSRKSILPGSNAERFAAALRSALVACRHLEATGEFKGKLKFNRSEVQLFINDRGLAPNTVETQTKVGPELAAFFEKVFGKDGFKMEFEKNPRERFGVTVTAKQPFDVEKLINSL